MFKTFFCAAAIGLCLVSGASGHDMTKNEAKVTVVFDHMLPNVKGKSMKGVLVEYGPGGSSAARDELSDHATRIAARRMRAMRGLRWRDGEAGRWAEPDCAAEAAPRQAPGTTRPPRGTANAFPARHVVCGDPLA